MSRLSIQAHAAGQGQAPPAQRLVEVFATAPADAAAMGFVLAHLPRGRAGPVLWVQDRLSRQEAGRPSLAGMAYAGIGAAQPLIMLDLSRPVDVLWALEEGLRCQALSAVVGEVWGDPAALDFTASKRLALRAEAAALPCWLIRRAARPNLSAARERWRLGSLPAAAHPHDPLAPGDPRWALDLFRARQRRPGQWVARHDRAQDCLDLSAAVHDRTLDAGDGPARERASG